MYPVLLSIGGLSLYSANVIIVLAWLVFSFIFWRRLRAHGIAEDAIFDLTFYATLAGLVAARLGYVLFHIDVFAQKSMVLILALWIAPGLSWYGGIVGFLATLVHLCRQRKVRLGLVLDALPVAIGLPVVLGKFASLADGAELGKITHFPWGIHFIGHQGAREPVQVYEMIAVLVLLLVYRRMVTIAQLHKWAYGIAGVWFFAIYSAVMFVLEFVKDSRVYWGNITANQWILIGIFAETIGVLYVRGGGREHMRPFFRSIGTKIVQRFKHMSRTLRSRNADLTHI